jgi:CBS domain-containing protein
MNVSDICRRHVITIRAHEELQAAAKLMRERHIGYLVVVEEQPPETPARPVGVLTDRDIVITVLAKGEDPRQLRVGDVMTREPLVIPEEKSLAFALGEMRKIGVRRVPVADSAGRLVGVLSLDDVLDAVARQLLGVVGSIHRELRTEGAQRP